MQAARRVSRAWRRRAAVPARLPLDVDAGAPKLPRMTPERPTGGRLVLVTIGIALAMFLAALDQTIVGTALPRIVAELQGLELYAWVLTAYLVTSTTMTPIAGKLGDLFGRKPLLVGGMIGFVLASALCGQAGEDRKSVV